MFTRNVLSTGRVMLTCNAVLTWGGRVHRPEYPVYMAHHLVDRVLSCWQDACHVNKTIVAVDKIWWCQQDILPCWQVTMPVDKTLPCWNGMYFADGIGYRHFAPTAAAPWRFVVATVAAPYYALLLQGDRWGCKHIIYLNTRIPQYTCIQLY